MISQADKIMADMAAAAASWSAASGLAAARGAGACYVTWRGYPLHFHTNVCGRCYSVVPEADATRFETEQQARAAASRHGLNWDRHYACVPCVP